MRLSSLLCCVSNTPARSDEVDEINKVAPKESQEALTEPYVPQRAQVLFNLFADEDDRDVIGPEGLEKLSKE
ncbi:hypothetical protein BDR03DRAFT_949280 [Suillus americanus]|nr:hypothetical protein BDR03DRAFT_949280 [Suillus americanus]